MLKAKWEKYRGLVDDPPLPKDIPFELIDVGITYEQFKDIWRRVKSGAPQLAAWRAAGLPGLYNQVRTLWKRDKEEQLFEETKCYIYFDMLYYDCLCNVSINLYKKATGDDKNAVNAAKLLLEYNEELLNNADTRAAI